jgi:hypothetical protein
MQLTQQLKKDTTKQHFSAVKPSSKKPFFKLKTNNDLTPKKHVFLGNTESVKRNSSSTTLAYTPASILSQKGKNTQDLGKEKDFTAVVNTRLSVMPSPKKVHPSLLILQTCPSTRQMD